MFYAENPASASAEVRAAGWFEDGEIELLTV